MNLKNLISSIIFLNVVVASTITVPGDHSTIQLAIVNAANEYCLGGGGIE